ncbi:F-box/LRR-repeat protein 6-like [Stylophora pistillata]|uniref:F-box/LRR-repeat protein 6-like n=1 Tax=Stylophora pistillata TaxID=50429 RepID=UPI000C039215|nr:F-box/LRR-repeat protein 6-like [Stylophora pistillata]
MARAKTAKLSPSTSCLGILRRRHSFGKRSKRATSSGSASDASDSATSSDEENNVTSHNRKGRKRNQEVDIVPCKKRKLSDEDPGEKEKSKLGLVENRIRTRIKAHIRARLKIREAEELRLLEIKALKENGWSKLIPHEVLLRIFKQVVSDIGPVPFLCRMSRVCHSWKQVASEAMLWREVNLSTMSIECPRSAIDSTIEKLAASKLKTVRELSLDGWSELTDTGLKAIGKHCRSLQSVVLSQCGSLSSKGVSSLASKCRQLKMLDVAMTKERERIYQ